MIQRQQTIWLLLATLCFGFQLYPELFLIKTASSGSELLADGALQTSEHPSLFYGSIVSAALSFLSIFLFKNRGNQILIAGSSALVQLLFSLGFTFYILYNQHKFSELKAEIGLYLGIFGVFSVWMAARRIRKDVEFLKSQDRLR